MLDIPQVTNAELEVLKVIWEEEPVKAADIIKYLERNKDWKPKTVKTLIRRLVDKGIIGFIAERNTYIYSANVKQEVYMQQETNNFIQKLFNGSISHMMLNFVKDKRLTHEEIAELIRILQDKEHKE